MANFRPLYISLILLGLLAVALISGGVMLAETNGANQSINDDPSISLYVANVNDTLATSSTQANSSATAMEQSSITLKTTFPVIDAMQGIWKTLKTAPITVWNLTFGLLLSNILGSSAYIIVMGVIGAILTVTIIVAVLKLISQGEGG